MYVQFYDKDLGFDRAASGYTAGTLASDAGAGLNNTDEKIGGHQLVTLTDGGLGTATCTDDDPGDVYAVIFAATSRLDAGEHAGPMGTFQPTEVPIGRTETQGTGSGRVALPLQVSGMSWSGATLRFRVNSDGKTANGRTVYVRFFDKDAGFDRDEEGNLGDAWDSDEPIGPMQPVAISDGAGWITATGDAVDPGDTYGG